MRWDLKIQRKIQLGGIEPQNSAAVICGIFDFV